MLGRTHPNPQQIPFSSSSTNTRIQFLDTIKAYLENNDIALIGPFTIEIRQPEDTRMHESKLFLSLTGEIRPESRSGSCRGSRGPSRSNVDPSDCFMGARRESITSLDERRITDLDESQTFMGLSCLEAPIGDRTPPLTWDLENEDFSDSFPSATLPSFSPAVTPNGVAAVSEQSLDNGADLVNLSRHDYLLPENIDLLHEFSTPGDRTALKPSTTSACSQTSLGVICGNGPARPVDDYLGTPGSVHDVSLASSLHFAHTPSTQTPLDSATYIHPQQQNQHPYPSANPYHPPLIDNNLLGATSPIVDVAAQNILRDDCLQFLEAELPRWTKEPLWNDARVLEPADGTSAFRGLELAYSSVCQLDVRMTDDAIRNRMALIRLHLEYSKACEQHDANLHARTIGRGGASVIIDTILKSIHKDWEIFDDRSKSDMRVKFHNRKRYGKRWLLLVNALGLGVLLVCSSKMANMVHNTTITVKALESIVQEVRTKDAATMRVLQIINPVAACLLETKIDISYQVEDIITQLRDALPADPAARGTNRAS